MLADNAVNRKQTDRALNYANRLTEAPVKHSKPEGTPAAQWERKRNAGLGPWNWIARHDLWRAQPVCGRGQEPARTTTYSRNQPMMGPALFYLAMANYQLGKMTLNKAKVLEAAKFSEQSATIESAFSD